MTTKVTGTRIVQDARRYLGIPYKYGGGPANPRAGLDCSGLVQRVAFDLGINSCPRTSEEQWTWCQHVTTPGPGDLVFFVGAEMDPSPGHVGIVVVPGRMIDAPFTGSYVQTASYSKSGTGINKVVGYGQMQGATSSPASQSSASSAGAIQTLNEGVAGGIATGAAAFVIIVIAVVAFLVLAAFSLL